jgi:hypothetical protein
MNLSRRNILKQLGLGSIAATVLPYVAQAEPMIPAIPGADDPAFWAKVRDQFALSKDKVFFNPGTVGAMPKVVVEKMVQHLNYIATDVADWAYKNDNKEEYISG